MSETEVVQVNYWKEMRKEIQDTIGYLHGLVLVTHNSVEFADIVDFLNKVRRNEQCTLLYISLINSYKNIKEVLEEKPLKNKKLYVVDCVSGFLIELQDEIDCVYRRPPQNLDAMKELIMSNINRTSPNIVVVDSLTQFINFSVPKESELHALYRFLKSIKSDALGLVSNTIILLYDDKVGGMKKLPTMFTNMILKLEVIKDKVEWRD